MTTGSQQGLDLVARVLIDPGDVILVELPTYVGAITAFRNLQARLVGVPQEADGIDLDALDATCERLRRDGRRVKFLYVVPNFQNPTGLLIGLDKRQRLLEWAERRDVLIVEDDPYRELYFEDSATRGRRAADQGGRSRTGASIYLSSFSKTLAPGFRVAWIAAPPALAAKLEMAKQAEDLLTGSLDQRMIYEACRRGVLERQLPMLRAHYAHKRDVMEQALRRELGTAVSWPKPKGGFFLWVTLRDRRSTPDAMIPRAIEHGVIYVAGDAFYVNGEGHEHAAAVVLGADAGADRRRRRAAGRYAPRRIGSTGDSGRNWRPGSVVSGTSGGSCSTTGQPDLRQRPQRRIAEQQPRQHAAERLELGIGQEQHARQHGQLRRTDHRRLAGRRDVTSAATRSPARRSRRTPAGPPASRGCRAARRAGFRPAAGSSPLALPVAVVEHDQLRRRPPARRRRGRATMTPANGRAARAICPALVAAGAIEPVDDVVERREVDALVVHGDAAR